MHPIGKISEQVATSAVRYTKGHVGSRNRSAKFAETRQEWLAQVAADRVLSETALRIALAWPIWLNSETLLAWPAQSTIAKVINCSDRAVRDALKRLEDQNHLLCVSKYRGGRTTNRYRIVLRDAVVCETNDMIGDATGERVDPSSAERSRQAGRHDPAALRGERPPVRQDSTDQGTQERTLERTVGIKGIEQTDQQDGKCPEPRILLQKRIEMLRAIYGASNVNENGHLLRNAK